MDFPAGLVVRLTRLSAARGQFPRGNRATSAPTAPLNGSSVQVVSNPGGAGGYNHLFKRLQGEGSNWLTEWYVDYSIVRSTRMGQAGPEARSYLRRRIVGLCHLHLFPLVHQVAHFPHERLVPVDQRTGGLAVFVEARRGH